MRDEEIDRMDELIREASKSHHPAYDDKAWEKMEALLNEHLPVKKDRRRPAIFFLLLLFIIAAGLFVIYQTGEHKKAISKKTKPANTRMKTGTPSERPEQNHLITIARDKSAITTPSIAEKSISSTIGGNDTKLPARTLLGAQKGRVTAHSEPGSADFTEEKGTSTDNTDNGNGIISPETNKPDSPDESIVIASSKNATNTQPLNSDTQSLKHDSSGGSLQKDITASPLPGSQGKSTAKPASKKKFANNFAVALSAGPDLSFVEPGNTGKTRLNYGVGLSYVIAKKITLRTGFFIARKTYAAMGGDYHPPDWYWTYNVKLKNVDADCNIYEVPLSAMYNFKQSKNHNWFAGVGLSTLFMKRETYNYLYDDYLGQPKRRTWTLRNGEQHYLSVLTVSGGYQYRINENITLMAEPYFKLPLHGIGFGKIKLNSGGLMLSASIRPFAKKVTAH